MLPNAVKRARMRSRIAQRAAKELHSGQVANLGVGIPTMIPDYLKPNQKVYLQSENGLLGMGPTPPAAEVDMDLISASKQPITMAEGAALFDSAASFGMIRGGHIDVAVMGALEVSETGDIANWAVPGENILGVGGAMDLVAGARRLIITLTHLTKSGEAKLVQELTCPVSGVRRADMVITEYGVFTFCDGRMVLEEIAPDITIQRLREITAARFLVSDVLQRMDLERHDGEKNNLT